GGGLYNPARERIFRTSARLATDPRGQELLEDHPIDDEQVVEDPLEAQLEGFRAARPFEEGRQERALLLAQVGEQAIHVAVRIVLAGLTLEAGRAPVDQIEGEEELEVFGAEGREQALERLELGQPPVLVFGELALADARLLGDLALALLAQVPQQAKGETHVTEHLHGENLSAKGARIQA